jgi:hypothetical protein
MRFITVLAVTTALVAPAAVHAQTASNAAQSTAVGEVVVTARKR